MGYQPFYIANYDENSGLNTDKESFLIPEKAFPRLDDAYCLDGKVKRRMGNRFLGRLRRVLPSTALAVTGAGNYTNADILSSVRATEPNAELEVGFDAGPIANRYGVRVTIDLGVPLSETEYVDSVAAPGVLTMRPGGVFTISAGTVNYATGAISLTFTVAPGPGHTVHTDSVYFPSLPCMGLRERELLTINAEESVAFDQKYAYKFNPALAASAVGRFPGRYEELVSGGPVWSGDSYKYFWTTNYWRVGTENVFWVTNNNYPDPAGGDPIRYFVGGAWTTPFNPVLIPGTTLYTCLCLLSFKSRLLAFNVTEQTGGVYNRYTNRIRWCAVGDPRTLASAWRSDTPGFGGFLDLPTEEVITSVEYLKDLILVKCETSSWKLSYTGNQALPFEFQKINTDFGSESTFNLVPFDNGVLAVGNYGVTNDDSTSVERVDLQVSYLPFRITNTGESIDAKFRHQIERVYGIRDFANELVYWAYPDQSLYRAGVSNNFCNRVLVYNYRNNTFARFNDFYTCFGKFQYSNDTKNLTDDSVPNFPEIIAGNQQGFVTVMNKQVLNEKTLAIKSIAAGPPLVLTVPSHSFNNLAQDYWVKIDGIVGLEGPVGSNPSSLNSDTSRHIYHVIQSAGTGPTASFQLEVWNEGASSFDAVTLPAGGTYLGGGTITIVQNFQIWTKVFAPFYEAGSQGRLGYLDFLVDKTITGEFSALLYVNEAGLSSSGLLSGDPVNVPIIAGGSNNFGLLGDNKILTHPDLSGAGLTSYQQQQAKIMQRLFTEALAQNFQLELTLNNQQVSAYPTAPGLFDASINSNTFNLHAMVLYLSPNARLTQ